MRDGFLLDPRIAYFNHGGYGACPVEVFAEYQRRQRELERDPTSFFVRQFEIQLWEARAALAAFVGASPSDLVFMPNATSALNAVIRSLRIRPEEEILTTKHEYGAILRTLGFIRANVVLVEPDELVENISIRTRAVVVSHITSPTALVLPIQEICEAARKAGVLSIVDGAHVPGHMPLRIDDLGADVYAGNCHKWLCAPKGCGFLWARPEHQDWIEPLVVSWGYQEDAAFGERHGWQGTRDPAAYLAVAAAIACSRHVRRGGGEGARRRGRAAARSSRAAAASRSTSTVHAGPDGEEAAPGRAAEPPLRVASTSRFRSTTGRTRRSCGSRSGRTTTKRTWSGWSAR